MTRVTVTMVVVVAHALSQSSRADDSNRLDRLVQQHEAGVGLVSSVVCKYELYNFREKCALQNSGTYFRDARGEVNEPSNVKKPGEAVKVVIAGGIMTTKARRPAGSAQTWVVSRNSVDPAGFGFTDIWTRCLFRVPMFTGANCYPVREYCERERSNLLSVASAKVGAESYSVVTFQFSITERGSSISGKNEIWFDEGRNYLIAKCVTSSGETYRRWEVDRFLSPAPGIYFPTQISERRRIDGVESQCVTVKLSDVRINTTIPATVYDASIPPSAEVLDLVTGRQYTTDASGKQVGESKTVARVPALPNPSGVSRTAEDAPPPTEQEPQSKSRFLLPAGIGCFCLGSIVWLVRRVRQGRTNA